ncbi:hypothetical protein WA026_021972 [Henosepilachna vigintioctopunctata]|uniref:SCP domain-containing protein n=1 Tax=Henosepilachna vigintioctopunctata TaxID=420089 RepID=A0AAW1VAQ6_9CUCU
MNYHRFCFILMIINYGSITSFSPTTDYCRVECPQYTTHSVCQRRNNCEPIRGCVAIQSDDAFREHMVKAHNELRNNIANGSIKGPYGNIGATNMNAISYDLELEFIASCWNNACYQLKHDDCRNTDRFWVGQNIWWGMGVNETIMAVSDWFNEIQYFLNPNWLKSFMDVNYPNDGNPMGHFTQVIWAETKYIGCSRVRYGPNSRETQIICNYGPAGNVIGMSIYKMAEDSSKIANDCSNGVNEHYTSLCRTSVGHEN